MHGLTGAGANMLNIIVFDDRKSIAHLILGFIASSLKLMIPVFGVFIIYEAVETVVKIRKHGEPGEIVKMDFISDIFEFAFGVMLGELFSFL